MSLIGRQQTCAYCGTKLSPEGEYNVESLVDFNVRYVVTCAGCTTYRYGNGRVESDSTDTD